MQAHRVISGAVALLCVVGCAGRSAETSTTTTTSGAIDPDDASLVREAAQGGSMEVMVGALAARRGVSPNVRAFGMRLVEDHTRVNDELRALASSEGVELTRRWTSDQQKAADELARAGGTSFDERFAELMVDDHEHDVKELTKASREAKDPAVRAWAARTLPVFEEHLREARALKAEVRGR